MRRILLIEPEPELASTVAALLHAERFEADLASDATTGFDKALTGSFDLIILDSHLRERSGFSLCRELRKSGLDTCILMLSQRTRAEDRVTALRLGADDCVPRSCDPNELLARIEAILRRVRKGSQNELRSVRFGDVLIHFTRSEASKADRPVSLSEKELRLLQYLISHRNKVVPRKELLSEVWGYDSPVSSRTIDVHIGWLRRKLEDDPHHPRHIKTIRGAGYRFDQDE